MEETRERGRPGTYWPSRELEEGGRAVEDRQRPGAPALCGQDLMPWGSGRSVQAGVGLTPLVISRIRGTEGQGGSLLSPLGVSQAGTRGGPAGLLRQEGNPLPGSSMWLADPGSLDLWGWGRVPPPNHSCQLGAPRQPLLPVPASRSQERHDKRFCFLGSFCFSVCCPFLCFLPEKVLCCQGLMGVDWAHLDNPGHFLYFKACAP